MENAKYKCNNTTNFKYLLIKLTENNNSEIFDWRNENYCKMISNLENVYEEVEIDKENMMTGIEKALDVEDVFKIFKNFVIKSNIIYEDNNYIYEILYYFFNNKVSEEKYMNKISNLINTNGEIIHFNCLLLKSYINHDDEKLYFADASIKDIEYILYNRVFSTSIIYDNDEFKEEQLYYTVFDKYKKRFFESLYVNEFEFKFLNYNIKIYYSENEFENNIFGDLLNNKKIDKCIILHYISKDKLTNLSLEEFKKINYLYNNKVSSVPPDEYINTILSSTKNMHAEIKKYNKQKILDIIYDKNK